MQIFKRSLVFMALLLGLWGCGSAQESKNGMVDVEPDDPQMLTAIEKSRATFPEFLAAYQSNDSTIQDFAIKVPFPAGERAEHIWLTVIQVTPDKILGVVNNEPELTEAVAFGDTVEIDSQTISDWNYIKGNKLYGGYSIRLLRNRMTPEQRAGFDY